jgi:hypothetical protein
MLCVICSSKAGSSARVALACAIELLTSMCGGQAGSAPLARQFQQLIDGGEILPGDQQARLCTAQFDVVLRHVGEHRYQHRPPILDRHLDTGIGRFHRTPHAPEQIDLPRGIGAELVLTVGVGDADAAAAGQADVADRI